MSIRDQVDGLREDAREYCEGRSPWVRAAFAVYLFYGGVRHVADPLYRTWFGGITLVFHEMGHVIFSAFGRTPMILGGSVMQLVVPLVAAIYLLLRQRDWYGLAVGQAWLAFSAWDLATYVADANKELLPLVSMGGTPEHDWSTLLTQWHCLNACESFAAVIRGFAFLTWASSIVLAGWLILTMYRSPAPPPTLVKLSIRPAGRGDAAPAKADVDL